MTTILITAVEASADRIGAALMVALKKRRKEIKFIGVGGPEMEAAGLESLFPMSEVAVMGFMEVLPKIFQINNCINQLVDLAVEQQPAMAITIDAHAFSSRLAKKLRGNPYLKNMQQVQYVAPKVWAWNQRRAYQLKNYYHHLLTVLPFEEAFFQSTGLTTTYVGHPMLTLLAPFIKAAPEEKSLTLALLPGSRASEITHHWPMMLTTYRRLKSLTPQLSGLLALPDEAALRTARETMDWNISDNIKITYGEERFGHLVKCRAALAKSGTNTLELALLSIPAIVVYKMNPITHWLAQLLVKIPYVALPNIILNPPKLGQKRSRGNTPPVYPEYIQKAANPYNLTRALHPLLTEEKPRRAQLIQLAKLHAAMRTPVPPAPHAAGVILSLLTPSAQA